MAPMSVEQVDIQPSKLYRALLWLGADFKVISAGVAGYALEWGPYPGAWVAAAGVWVFARSIWGEAKITLTVLMMISGAAGVLAQRYF